MRTHPGFQQWLVARLASGSDTRDSIAAAAGIDVTNVSRWLKRGGRPSVMGTLKIARACGEAPPHLLRLCGYQEVAEALEFETAGAPRGREVAPGWDHDCWKLTGMETLKGLPRADEKHRAVLEIHERIKKRKIQPEVDAIVLNVLRVYYRARGFEEKEIDAWTEVLLRSA